jgi:hypothetical protein
MADEQGTFELITRHLVLAVEPLRRAVADLDSFRTLLRRLGWEASSIPQPYQDLAGTVDDAIGAIEALAADPDPSDVANALDLVRRLYEEIDQISQAPAGISAADVGTFLGELAASVLELLMVEYLAAALPRVYRALNMLGVVEQEWHDATATRPAYLRTRLRYDELPKLFTDPGSLPRRVYGWGTPGFRFEQLRDDVFELLWALRLPATIEPVPPALATGWLATPAQAAKPIETRVRLDLFEFVVAGQAYRLGLSLTELPAEGAVQAGVIIQPDVPQQVGVELPVTATWKIQVRAGTDLASLFGLLIRPSGVTVRYPFAPGTQLPSAGFAVTLVYDAGAVRRVLLGRPNASRLEIGGAAAGLGVDVRQGDLEVSAGLELRQLAAVVTAGELDGFLGRMLGGATIVIPIRLGLTWSSNKGFKFTGEAGFEVVLHPNLKLGPVGIDKLLLALRSGTTGGATPKVALAVGVAISGALGPVAFAVDGLGLTLDVLFEPGNAGPLSVQIGLRPPSGLGLAINASIVSGGGFIAYDEAAGRYFGVFAVRVGPVSVTAIGMLDTRLPSGQQGFSLFVMLAARFSGIQLGYGFMLTGLGGALGVNRRFDTDALRDRFASGAVGRILAPENPVRDAPLLLGELGAIFPPAQGVFVVGPTVELTWINVVRADLGIFIELPGPTKIVLLGVVRVALPMEEGDGPALQLRCDILGVLDFVKAILSFDAVLVDSTLLEVFTLTGGIAFRLSWGAEPYVLLSVGGFHPSFNPAPLVLPPSLTRMAMSYSMADVGLTLRLEGYFAITPNTLQLGARIDAAIEFGPLSARGFIAFDMLIQFQPFAFQFDFEARMEVRWRGRTLAGLRVKGSMAGPGPVVFSGEVCIEILFFSICAHATFELGSDAPPVVTPVPSALDALAGELADLANLSATGGDPLVGLRPAETGTSAPVLPPTGELVWRQRRAPLGLLLEKFENAPLTSPETVTASSPLGAGAEDEWFSPGSFAALDDAEALNRPAFERLAGGLRIGAGGTGGSSAVTHQVTVVEFRLPDEPSATSAAVAAPAWLLRAADARAGIGGGDRPAPAVAVAAEPWQVRDEDGQVLAAGTSQAQAHQLARARLRAGRAATAHATGDTVTLNSM